MLEICEISEQLLKEGYLLAAMCLAISVLYVGDSVVPIATSRNEEVN